MSENNQNKPTAPEEAKKNHGRGRNYWRNKKKHRSAQGNAEQQSPAPMTEAVTSAEKPKKDRPNRQRPQNDRKLAGGKGNRGYGQGRYEKRPYDPYETPSKEEIALSELRAQIVLQSADGTTPMPYGASSLSQPTEPTSTVTDTDAPMLPVEEATESSNTETVDEPTVEVVGVRFRASGKMYYFDPHGIEAKKGSFAIVETTRGPEFGEICMENKAIKASTVVSPLRPVLRIASPEDIVHNEENRKKEQEALPICQAKIQAHGLEMKLIDAQYAFDNSKLLFYFSAEGRIDFRELVKDLASVFRTRIELRQIGIRDEAKMLGGIGACGRLLCCSSFLPDFAQVSIKMAKEQSLSLNSSKISGVCGRLMCCLRYESEVYTEEIRKTPPTDSTVRTEDGVGTVISTNPLAGTVRVALKDSPDTAPKQYHRDDVILLSKDRRGGNRGAAESADDIAKE